MEKLYNDCKDLCDEKFGKTRDVNSIITHLKKEIEEMREEIPLTDSHPEVKIKFLREAADVQILLYNLLGRLGFSYEEVIDTLLAKLTLVQKRAYRSHYDGTMSHLRTLKITARRIKDRVNPLPFGSHEYYFVLDLSRASINPCDFKQELFNELGLDWSWKAGISNGHIYFSRVFPPGSTVYDYKDFYINTTFTPPETSFVQEVNSYVEISKKDTGYNYLLTNQNP